MVTMAKKTACSVETETVRDPVATVAVPCVQFDNPRVKLKVMY